MTRLGKALAISAMTGILAGSLAACGGGNTPAASPGDANAAGAKASCNGPDHTDKGHCAAKAACSGPDHTEKGHCNAAAPAAPKS